MGKKVDPNIFRLSVRQQWRSSWYAKKAEAYSAFLIADCKIREFIYKKFGRTNTAEVFIERQGGKVRIKIHSDRPGSIIGRKGTELEAARKELLTLNPKTSQFILDVVDVPKSDLNASLVASNIAERIEQRKSVRRVMRDSIRRVMRSGAKGVKILCSGRLGGAEIARTDRSIEGSVPTHTLSQNIDYAGAQALTTYGTCGVKVWIALKKNEDTKFGMERTSIRRSVQRTDRDRRRSPRPTTAS
jgi:small subunit ribosomal protein S3